MILLLWENRTKVLTVVSAALIALCVYLGQRIAVLNSQLAAKPQVEERTVQGPVRVVEKIVKEPSGVCTIERTTDSGPVVTESVSKPICPAVQTTSRYVGVMASKNVSEGILKAGISISRFDIGYGFEPKGFVHRLDVTYRF